MIRNALDLSGDGHIFSKEILCSERCPYEGAIFYLFYAKGEPVAILSAGKFLYAVLANSSRAQQSPSMDMNKPTALEALLFLPCYFRCHY